MPGRRLAVLAGATAGAHDALTVLASVRHVAQPIRLVVVNVAAKANARACRRLEGPAGKEQICQQLARRERSQTHVCSHQRLQTFFLQFFSFCFYKYHCDKGSSPVL